MSNNPTTEHVSPPPATYTVDDVFAGGYSLSIKRHTTIVDKNSNNVVAEKTTESKYLYAWNIDQVSNMNVNYGPDSNVLVNNVTYKGKTGVFWSKNNPGQSYVQEIVGADNSNFKWMLIHPTPFVLSVDGGPVNRSRTNVVLGDIKYSVELTVHVTRLPGNPHPVIYHAMPYQDNRQD